MALVVRGRDINKLEPDFIGGRLGIEQDVRLVPAVAKEAARSICCIVKKTKLVLDKNTHTCQVRDGLKVTHGASRRYIADQSVIEKKRILTGWLEGRWKRDHQGADLSNEAVQKIQKLVDDLPWPSFRKSDIPLLTLLESSETVHVGFEDQVVLGSGTAFVISPDCVATAAHVAATLDGPQVKGKQDSGVHEYVVVFDYVDDLTRENLGGKKFPYFELDSIILQSPKRTTNHVLNDPMNFRLSPEDLDKMYMHHDLAVIKLVIPAGTAPRPALNLLPYTPRADTDVWWVAHPGGLPMKYCKGGKVRQEVVLEEAATLYWDKLVQDKDMRVFDEGLRKFLQTRPPGFVIQNEMNSWIKEHERNHWTTDIDEFKGCSGCPIFITIDGAAYVAGILTMGSLGLPSYVTTHEADISPLNKKMRETLPLDKNELPDTVFTDSFSQLHLLKNTQVKSDKGIWTFARIPESHFGSMHHNAMNRIDVITHLVRPLGAFINGPSPSQITALRNQTSLAGYHPGGIVRLVIKIKLGGSQDRPMSSGIVIKVKTPQRWITVAKDSGDVAAGRFSFGKELTYSLAIRQTSQGRVVTKARNTHVQLSEELADFSVLDWSQIIVRRVDNEPYQYNECEPDQVKCILTFKFMNLKSGLLSRRFDYVLDGSMPRLDDKETEEKLMAIGSLMGNSKENRWEGPVAEGVVNSFSVT